MTQLIERLQSVFAGSYALERELGGGGMSRVFLADETALHRRVVIKVLPPEMGAGVNKERFELETQLAASLQHPLIVPILTAGSAAPAEPDLLYYVMPYIEGQALRERIDREGELPLQEAVRILRDVADALARAHEAGVVHRDIKPDNVMLSGKHAMVTDFGIAKAVSASQDATGTGLTQMGMSLGTPMYMAPEQAAGDPNVDHRADIYSLGVMAYEMLAGRLPFVADSAHGLLAAHISEIPAPLTSYRTSVPAPVANAVMRCLEKRPADRWQSAEELAAVLEGMTGSTGALTPVATPAIDVEAFVRSGSPLRVMGTFAAVGAAALTAVYFLMIQLGLPDWTFQGAAALTVAAIVGGGVSASRSGAGWPRLRRIVTGGYGLFAAGIVLYSVMRALGIGPVGTLVAAGRIDEQSRVILARFDNTTGDSTLAETVTELLRIDIAQSPTISLVDLPVITGTLQRMERDPSTPLNAALALEVAERAGANAVLTGDIRSLGSDLVISARLVSTATGETLAALRETARDGAVVDAIDRLSAALRERIGESLKTIRADAPLAEVTTGSTAALRLYAQAEMANDVGDPLRAIDLLDEALSIDSGFGMAHRKLAIILRNRNLEPARARAAFTRAYELRHRLTERERLLAEAAYYSYVADSIDASTDAYEALLAKYPTDRIGLNNLAVNYRQLGRDADAERLYRRSIQQGGAPTVTFSNAMQIQYQLGLVDSARATLGHFKAEHPTHPALLNSQLAFAMAEFDYESAKRLTDSIEANPTGIPSVDVGMRFEQGSLAAIEGRLGEARQHLLDAYDGQAAARLQFVSSPRVLFAGVIDAFIALSFHDDPDGAVEVIETAMTISQYDALPVEQREDLDLAVVFARAGQPDRAREMIARYETNTPATETDWAPELWSAYGTISLAEARFDDAIAEFSAGKTAAPLCQLCFLPQLGEAFLGLGHVDSAIAVFERYLETPTLFRSQQDNFNLWTVLLGLGDAYERAGRTDDAVAVYDRLLNQWAHADAALNPKIQDIRARVAALVAEPGSGR